MTTAKSEEQQLAFLWQEPRPFAEAPLLEGHRILAWCEAAESRSGWAEYICCSDNERKLTYRMVISHPHANACMCPAMFINAPASPYEEQAA